MNTEELYHLFRQYPLISIDSRKDTKGALFFCLWGEHFDGNRFALDALNNGAAYAIIDNPEFQVNEQCILVNDTLMALQQLASFHRSMFDLPVIGITGTNGKTTTKELMTEVLSRKYNVTSTKGNLNNHIGVPLTLLSITQDTEIAIVEMGANHPGEIATLCEISKPNFGLITNIGKAHLEGFGSIKNIIETKTALYKSVYDAGGKLFVNSDDAMLTARIGMSDPVTYGVAEGNFCPGKITSADPFVSLKWGSGYSNVVQTQLVGAYNFENVLAAACIGLFFGLHEADISDAIQNYRPSNMRSQFCRTAHNSIILDAYNANPSSMIAAIENFNAIPDAKKVCILGDMLELGEISEKEHLAVLRVLAEQTIDTVILVGPVFSKINPSIEFKCFMDSGAALKYLLINPIHNATILLKGSRGIQMEKILEAL
jgi:UDP-N-acetylmuramoyl-tripeptide--D-alanyl-D-alanine ligase